MGADDTVESFMRMADAIAGGDFQNFSTEPPENDPYEEQVLEDPYGGQVLEDPYGGAVDAMDEEAEADDNATSTHRSALLLTPGPGAQ